jgi:DNA-binding IclR family transcriptional regulator
MAQAPAVTRAVLVLRALEAGPREGLTLAGIARATGLQKTTCRSVVHELLDAGFAYRDPRAGMFRLGSPLINLGRAALGDAYDAVHAAGRRMAHVCEVLDVTISATAMCNDDIVILACYDPDRLSTYRAVTARPVPTVP